jgi:orotate phosphoribosyltransferase
MLQRVWKIFHTETVCFHPDVVPSLLGTSDTRRLQMTQTGLVHVPSAEDVARALVLNGCYLINLGGDPQSFYEWKSGIVAPCYTDCRVLMGAPGARSIVKRALAESIRATFPGADCVVGMAEAGIVWSSLTADDLGLPHAFVRKQKKPHGRPALVEGAPKLGGRAVLVDDLVATGESLEAAVAALADEANITTVGVQSIVNWNFAEMRERFNRLDVPVKALVSYPDLLAAMRLYRDLPPAAGAELTRFYANPRGHTWNLTALGVPVPASA